MEHPPSRPQARPLRICMVVPYDISPEAGGVKQHAVHLMAGLRRLGDEVTLIGPASSPVTAANTHGFGGIVNIPGNGSDNHMALLCSPWALKRFFARNSFDVIHMHEPEVPALSYWTAWMQRRVAQVATFHAFAERPKWPVPLVRRAVGKLLFRRMMHGIAVSEGAKALAEPSFGRPLSIVPNGVDHRLFNPDGPKEPGASAQSGSGPGSAALRLLFVGGVHHPRKGARYLFEALRLARQQHPQVSLTVDVVGAATSKGGAPTPWPEGVRHHSDVSTQKLAALYRSCDALVAPATGQESFGIILLEAMASGKPMIVSDIEGYRRVLRHGGIEGALMVPPQDAQALCRAMVTLAGLPASARASMGEHNRRSVAPFTWDTITTQVRAVYEDSLARAHAAP